MYLLYVTFSFPLSFLALLFVSLISLGVQCSGRAVFSFAPCVIFVAPHVTSRCMSLKEGEKDGAGSGEWDPPAGRQKKGHPLWGCLEAFGPATHPGVCGVCSQRGEGARAAVVDSDPQGSTLPVHGGSAGGAACEPAAASCGCSDPMQSLRSLCGAASTRPRLAN